MRFARIAAIVLGIAIVLAVLAWYLRDTLIREISNPLLEKHGIVVTDVSLDALATSDASIAYLELTYENDTVISITGLTLPISGAPDGLKTYTAQQVSIAMPESEESLEIAPHVDRILALAGELAGNEFRIAELHVPPYPAVYDLRWALADEEQTLDARLDPVSMTARIRSIEPDAHAIDFSIPGGRISANLQRDESGYALRGSSDLELAAWSPLAKLAGVVPSELSVDSGTGRLTLNVEIPYDAATPPNAVAELEVLSPMGLAYAHESGETTSITVRDGSPMELNAVFPQIDWTLRQANSALLVSYDDWNDIPLTISNILCKPGPECSTAISVSMENRALPVGDIDEANLSALASTVFTEEAVQIELQPGAALELHQLESSGILAGRVEGRLVSSASLEIVDAGWMLAAASIDANVEGLRLAEDVNAKVPVFLENVGIKELDGVVTLESGIYAPGIRAQWRKQEIDIGGVKGALRVQGNEVRGDFETLGLYQEGSLHLLHDLQSGDGALQLAGAVLSLGEKALSDRVSPWSGKWDIRGGDVGIGFEAEWQDSAEILQGNASAVISGLSGFHEDSVFAGLSTSLEIEYSAEQQLSVAPGSVAIEMIDVGMPISDIQADYTLDVGDSSVAVENLRMSAFGGKIHAEPFSFRTDIERNTLVLHAESIDMDELLTVKEFEAIEVSGTVRAELPVSIEGDMITISDGTLSGEPPGGVIRYLPEAPPDESDVSSLAFVRRVLSNFEYKSLSSVVNYSETGDLKLQLRLEGRNPDMEETRPVVLNLDVENNVLQMLRSLRATRAVEEVLEQRFLQQRDDDK